MEFYETGQVDIRILETKAETVGLARGLTEMIQERVSQMFIKMHQDHPEIPQPLEQNRYFVSSNTPVSFRVSYMLCYTDQEGGPSQADFFVWRELPEKKKLLFIEELESLQRQVVP